MHFRIGFSRKVAFLLYFIAFQVQVMHVFFKCAGMESTLPGVKHNEFEIRVFKFCFNIFMFLFIKANT